MKVTEPQSDARERPGEAPARRGFAREYAPVLLALLGGLGLTAGLTLNMRNHAADVVQYDFSEEAKACVRVFERELNANIDLVRWLAATFTATPDLSLAEFQSLGEALSRQKALPMRLYWAPAVPPAAREAFEVAGRAATGREDFAIRRTVAVAPVQLPAPEVHVPVYYAPRGAPEIGLDLASDPETFRYLARAAETGRMFFPSGTPALKSIDESGAVLAICPVYRAGMAQEAPEARREALLGFTIGLIQLAPLTGAAFSSQIPLEIDVHVFDFFGEPGRQFLHFQPGNSQGVHEPYMSDVQPMHMGSPHYVGAIELGDTRRWLVACTPAPAYEIGLQSWSPLLGLALGLAFTAVVAYHFHANVRQRRAAELLVLRRTAALNRTNARLVDEASARKRFERERDGLLELLEASNASLQQVNARLERSNRDLQDFALVASHDLKEPLRKVRVLAQSLRDKLGARLEPGGGEYLDLMEGSLRRMHELITNLLQVSRVSTHGQPFERVDLGEIFSEVISDLAVRIKETGGEIAVSPFPSIEADPMQMRQVVQNILDNSLKYHREGVPPRISVEAITEPSADNGESNGHGGTCTLVFRDNGIGIAPESSERAFTLFQRLNNGARVEGSGVGLAVCRKIAERHGGSIRVESEAGRGSTFTITLPVRHRRNGVAK